MARIRDRDQILMEMEKLENELKEVDRKQADRIARIAVKSGLARLKISDKEMEAFFRDFVASTKDQNKSKGQIAVGSTKKAKETDGTGKAE